MRKTLMVMNLRILNPLLKSRVGNQGLTEPGEKPLATLGEKQGFSGDRNRREGTASLHKANGQLRCGEAMSFACQRAPL
jgi:hypothetical protein